MRNLSSTQPATMMKYLLSSGVVAAALVGRDKIRPTTATDGVFRGSRALPKLWSKTYLGGGPWILLPLAACSILLATLGALALIPKLPGTFQPRTIPQPSRSPQPNSIATMKYLFSAVVVAAALVGQTSSANSAIRGADSNGGDLVSFAVVPFVLFSSFMIFINHLRNWRRSMRREVGRTT